MEKRGIRTERGDLNHEIEVINQKLRQLKARISKLQKWLKEESENNSYAESRVWSGNNSIFFARFRFILRSLYSNGLP